MRVCWLVAAPLVLAIALLGGCERESPKPGKGAGKAVTEVRLGYFANVTHAQAVLGVSSGEFAAAIGPAKLSTKVFNAGPALIEALFGSEIDIGYVGPGPVLSAFAKSHGEGIRVISGSAANGVLIVARKDSGIATFANLKGKRIATPQYGNTQDVAARHYLIAELKESDASDVLAVANSEQAGLMSRGQIDAAWVPEPWGSRLISETGATLVGEEKDLWPGKQFSLTVVVTTPEFLAKHADVVKRVLRVHASWTRRLQAEPLRYADQLDAALADLLGKKLPAGLVAKSLGHVTFTDDALPATFETMERWAFDLGFAREQTPLAGLFVGATQPLTVLR